MEDTKKKDLGIQQVSNQILSPFLRFDWLHVGFFVFELIVIQHNPNTFSGDIDL